MRPSPLLLSCAVAALGLAGCNRQTQQQAPATGAPIASLPLAARAARR
jgi:hypothetical protein